MVSLGELYGRHGDTLGCYIAYIAFAAHKPSSLLRVGGSASHINKDAGMLKDAKDAGMPKDPPSGPPIGRFVGPIWRGSDRWRRPHGDRPPGGARAAPAGFGSYLGLLGSILSLRDLTLMLLGNI